MRRRGNKSHKVPNVKLRPAQPQSLANLKVESEQCWAQDSQTGSDDTRTLDSCPRPFRGIVVCATGVVDKPTLFKQALELGATSVSAFTDRVTHLVAVDHGGAKYNCALERKIPILTPSWIAASYQVWLRGDDVDVDESVRNHRLPIFSGVILCPSGITDITRRTQISKILMENGGTYVKNLERPVKVTHLLCSGDDETDKMSYAEKFNSRGEARIHLIWEEWFWDSLEFGGRFDEATYQVRRPRPERKIMEMSSPSSSFAVTSQLNEEKEGQPVTPEKQRPAAQESDDLDDETACVNVLPAITLQVWGGLLERRGYEVAGGEIVRSPTKSQTEATSDLRHNKSRRPSPRKTGSNASVINAFRSANSFAPVQMEASGSASQRPIPFKRASTTTSAHSKPKESNSAVRTRKADENIAGPSGLASGSAPPPAMPLIFIGLSFCLLGEAKTPAVKDAIEESGGQVLSKDDHGNVDFVVVRLLSGSKLYREESDEALRAKYRTECWLERCIHEERVCPVEDHVSFMPLVVNIPVTGAEAIQMGLSGLDQSESCHTRRLLKAFGITVVPLFSRKSTHLLCPSRTGLKFEKACEWGIPVISNEWLAIIASTGVIPPVDDHLAIGFAKPIGEANDIVDVKGKGRAVSEVKDRPIINKGKGKLKVKRGSLSAGDDMDVDGKMNDITNSTPPDIAKHVPLPPPLPSNPIESDPFVEKKVSSLERQATTLLPQPPSQRDSATMAFGRPNETLGGSSYYVHPSSVQTLPQSHATPLVRYGTCQNSLALSVNGSFTRSLSYADPEPDDGEMRIPSSKSPSPMKGPKRMNSLSPVKLDPGAAKALQESITSLLGKRQSPEDEPQEGGSGKSVGAGDKKGKRIRRQRSKPQTRQTSHKFKSPVPVSNPVADAIGGGVSFDPFGSGSNVEEHRIPGDSQTLDESMRVLYEDPAQLEERQRLMSLLKTKADDDVLGRVGSSGTRRKSTRIAGFL